MQTLYVGILGTRALSLVHDRAYSSCVMWEIGTLLHFLFLLLPFLLLILVGLKKDPIHLLPSGWEVPSSSTRAFVASFSICTSPLCVLLIMNLFFLAVPGQDAAVAACYCHPSTLPELNFFSPLFSAALAALYLTLVTD